MIDENTLKKWLKDFAKNPKNELELRKAAQLFAAEDLQSYSLTELKDYIYGVNWYGCSGYKDCPLEEVIEPFLNDIEYKDDLETFEDWKKCYLNEDGHYVPRS